MLNLNDWTSSIAQPTETEVMHVDEERDKMLASPSSLVIELISRVNEENKTGVTDLKIR